MSDNVYRVGIEGDASGLKKAGREGKDALKSVDDQAKKTNQSVKQGFEDGSAGAGMMDSAVSSLTARFGAMQVATKVLDAIVTCMDQAQDSIRKAATDSTLLESSLREIVAMKGRLGHTGPEALANLKTRAQTLQSSDEVKNFQETMEGSGGSSIDNLISRSDFDKLAIKAGSFQAAEGGNAATHGQLAGMMPALMGRKVNDKEAFGKEQQLYNILQPGGASFSSGIDQLLKVAPLTSAGVYKDIADEAAVLSAFSVNNKLGAGENTMQFTRATVGGLGKLKSTPIEGDSEKQGQYLRGVGANDQMDPIQIGKLISGDLANQEKASSARGEQLNVMSYLRHHGYSNQEDILSLMSFHGMQKTGQFKKFEDLANPANAGGGGAAQEKMDAFQATSQVAMQRKAEVAESLAKYNVGSGPMQYFQSLQRASFANAKGQKDSGFYGEVEQWKDDSWQGGKKKLLNRMTDDLLKEADRVGVSVSYDEKNKLTSMNYANDDELAKRYFDLGTRITAQGGSNMPGMDALIGKADEQLKVSEQMRDAYLSRQRAAAPQPTIPAPLNGPPPNWNPRP
jgi:hypothetical protein